MRSDRERLLDILEAVERIEVQAARGRSTFADEELAQTAVIRWIEIIGEAARGVIEELRQAYPEVPWRRMVAMRNVLIHGYFDIDVDLVWSVAQNDLPKLAAQVRAILEGRVRQPEGQATSQRLRPARLARARAASPRSRRSRQASGGRCSATPKEAVRAGPSGPRAAPMAAVRRRTRSATYQAASSLVPGRSRRNASASRRADGVAGAAGLVEQAGEGLEEAVAHGVAAALVDLGEPVQVGQDHRHRAHADAGQAGEGAQPLLGRPAVGQAGQGVGEHGRA